MSWSYVVTHTSSYKSSEGLKYRFGKTYRIFCGRSMHVCICRQTVPLKVVVRRVCVCRVLAMFVEGYF